MAIPTISGGIFNFTVGGYVPPTFSGSVYKFGTDASSDLGATVSGVLASGFANLSAYTKSAIQAYKNLGASVYGIPPANLSAQIHGFDTRDLPATLHGWKTENLLAYVCGYPPVDLPAYVYGYPPIDLPASITGEWWHGTANLGAEIYKIWQRGYKDLSAVLYGWAIKDLSAEINSVYKTDLPAIIQSTTISDLAAYLSAIDPINLPASIHGWATEDLQAILIGGYGPNDLQASIVGTGGYKNLSAYIRSMIETEVPYDLQGIVEGYHSFDVDLNAYIFATGQIADLIAYITATGQIADLPASIIPRVIHLKQAIRVALLEHLDLGAMINSSCFASGSINLGAYVYPLMKADLRAVIFGWHVNIYSNVADLAAVINVGVLGVEDKLPISFVVQPLKYTILRIKFATKPYRVFDTLRILFGSYYTANLPAIVTGVLESVNLPAYIKAVFDWNYSELPPYVNPKTHEIVIDFDANGYENWRRFVEIFFDFTGDSPYHYFYVSGADKVYRVDRDRHWVVRAKSYKRVSGMIERRSVRRKYIFKMSDYANVDEAVRDLIDRVSTYRRSDLGAYINAGVFCPHLNLGASINPVVKYSWVKHLHASAVGRLRFYKGTENFDLSASITGV